jgi:hypothetical protein
VRLSAAFFLVLVGAIPAFAQPAPTLAGHVTFQRTMDSPPLDHTTVVIALTPLGNPDAKPVTSHVNLDGTWALTVSAPGTYVLSTVLPPAFERWWTQSAVSSGRDLLDERIEVTADTHVLGVLLTFIDRRPELSGTLRTAAGVTVSDQVVVIFPVAEKLRESPRRVAWTKSDAMGRYRFPDLPAGEYWIVILSTFDPRDLDDSLFFDVVAAGAEKLTMNEFERKRLDLTAK